MNKIEPALVTIILKYDAPLQRYARRLVKNEAIAAAIVKEVFEQVYDLNSFNTDSATLRNMFKGHTFKLASSWLHAQSHPDTQNN